MTTNNIKDVKTVDAENFDYLLAESNFRIESVFRSRNKAFIPCLNPILGKKIEDFDVTKWVEGDAQTYPGNVFNFNYDAVDYKLIDLKDWVFDIQGQFYWDDTAASNNAKWKPQIPVFGNQFLFSLFSSMELYIDDTLVQRINNPGMCSNAEYALRYPHNKEEEKTLTVHGWCINDPLKYKLENNATSNTADVIDSYNPGIWLSWKQIEGEGVDKPQTVRVMGNFAQRIRLADMFSVVDTLPPIYDHKITVRLQRSNHNYMIVNTANCKANEELCKFIGFNKFQGYIDEYVTTDQYIATAKKYYSKPIETLITMDKQLLVPLLTKPSKASEQTININVDAAFKNKLLTLAIPRTTNFTGQRNKIKHYLASNIDNTKAGLEYDVLKAPANSYTFGGLKSLIVCAGGTQLYKFDMGADGTITGDKELFKLNDDMTQYNVEATTTGANKIYMSNYQNVYEQYKRARLHFQQLEDEALDFGTFMKEYCIYCVDLSCFTLTPGQNITVELTTDKWGDDYNPYYAYNSNKLISDTTKEGEYTNTSININMFYDKVLRLLPNHRIELADMISTSSVEVENSNMA